MNNKNIQIILAIMLLFTISCNNTTTQNQPKSSVDTIENNKAEKLPFSVTTLEVCNDFSTNYDNALNKYRNNIVTITGTVVKSNDMVADDCRSIILSCNDNATDTIGTTIKCCLINSTNPMPEIIVGNQIVIQAKFKEMKGNQIIFEEGVIK